MPADMKSIIAEAALSLITEKKMKKLTVKDIVERCNITRQTFYYHFEDIPALFGWMIKKFTDRMLKEVMEKESAEDGLGCFFAAAINAMPYIKRCMDSSYRDELELLFRRYFHQVFENTADKLNYYSRYSSFETKIILRYHSAAVLGLLQEWTPQDTEQLDKIVHTVYLLITEGIPIKPVN